MQSTIRRAGGLLLLAAFALNTGCAAFPANKLEDSKVPDVSGKPYHPSAYVEVKFFRGKPDTAAAEFPALKGALQVTVDKVLKESGIFSRYSFDPFDAEKSDVTVKLHYYNYGEAGGAVILGVICGATLGVIPAAATDQYTLLASVGKESAIPPKHSDDSITTWMGLWFLPLSGKTIQRATNSTFEEMTRDGLRQLVADNQIPFVAPAPATTAAPAAAVAQPVATTPSAAAAQPASKPAQQQPAPSAPK